MAFVARLSGDTGRFEIDAGETVLDAALRHGIALEYGCRHGNCSKCKYYLEEGDVDFGDASVYSLSEEEREEGYGLMCCATPLTDLVIETRSAENPKAKPHITPQGRAARVAQVSQLTPALWHFVLTIDEPLEFYAGQFVELKIAGTEVWRSYSVASDPAHSTRLEFVIKHVEGGAFSGRLPHLEVGRDIALRGPYGMSYLRDGADDVVLVATGSGISPILSMLRSASEGDDGRRFTLFYGARTPDDIPCSDEMAGLTASLGERLSINVCLSTAPESWAGRKGRVTQALQSELQDASSLAAYICGSPEMCDTVGSLLEAKGIPESELFYDKFHAAVGV